MRKIILASASPRRKELVAQMGFAFECIPSNFDEQLDDNRSIDEVAKELGLGKALDVARQYPAALVIGSDTIVLFEGQQLGKQPDAATARKLLQRVSGQRVEVVTSVALVCQETGLAQVEVDRAAVVYAQYGVDAIDEYLASSDWQDKAGAMASQSPVTPPVDYLEGDYDTILGISTRLLHKMLATQGIACKEVHLELPYPSHPLAQTTHNAL